MMKKFLYQSQLWKGNGVLKKKLSLLRWQLKQLGSLKSLKNPGLAGIESMAMRLKRTAWRLTRNCSNAGSFFVLNPRT